MVHVLEARELKSLMRMKPQSSTGVVESKSEWIRVCMYWPG